MAYAHNIYIQMQQKERTKAFPMISNWKNPLVSMVYKQKVIQRLEVNAISGTFCWFSLCLLSTRTNISMINELNKDTLEH